MPFLFGGLSATLVLFGVLADRGLVGQARTAHAVTAVRADAIAQGAALSVRAFLAQAEQAIAAGHPPAGVTSERLALPPPPSFPVAPFRPYATRSREELSLLLSSDSVTPSALPEAVVARLILGEAPAVTGAGEASSVEERLLSGRIPVRPEDLPELARRLGVELDPRVRSLQSRLRRLPPEIPPLPVFRRRLAGDAMEGWSRTTSAALRYQMPVARILEPAKAAGEVSLASSAERETGAALGATARSELRRFVPVPDVEGLILAVTPEVPGSLRLAALRVVLLVSVVAGAAGLVAAQRALAKETRATARERAFLTNVTHELRTPLTAIRLFGETLAEGRGDPREYGALVAQESERLSDLVERVLAATRVDESPRFGSVSPAELARSAVALIETRAERRRVQVKCSAEEELPLALWDGDAVRRALLNLLDNAVKHGREGGHVEVRTGRTGDQVHFVVTDDGPGIGPVHRRGLFHRFTRGASEAQGAGLGLYLVDQVARAHGGHVDLETEEARGSTFTLALPIVPPGAEASA
jgi:two-component system phosphate regulon sensor histidine kinase PhoR